MGNSFAFIHDDTHTHTHLLLATNPDHLSSFASQIDCGLLVVAYKDGSPAHPHYMDSELCSEYWNKWLLRLEEYKEKKKDRGAV